MACVKLGAMDLLERDGLLARLEELLADASGCAGRLCLVAGEAGAGKSALIRAFVERHRNDARVLEGACDPLSLPRALGPFVDMFGQELNAPTSRAALLPLIRDRLNDRPHPTIALVEDVHWADEASLDVVRYVARRLEGMRTLVVVTYRDDELGMDHPLRLLLGDLVTRGGVSRLSVPALSPEAVARLALGTAADPRELYERTGGNAFFVTEVLANTGSEVPATVRDAVLARQARLLPEAGRMLECAAVLGPRVDPDILLAASGRDEAALDACLASGMLTSGGSDLSFRHELARLAIIAELPRGRARDLHRRALEALQRRGTDEGRLAFHAEGAGFATKARDYYVAAGLKLRALGSHREAARQLQRALSVGEPLPPLERLPVLEAYAEECRAVDRVQDAISAREEAVELARDLGDVHRQAGNLSHLALTHVRAGRNADAERSSREALELLRGLPICPETADALAAQALLRMLNRDHGEAIDWGERALQCAEELGYAEAVGSAHNIVGTVLILLEIPAGIARMQKSIDLLRDSGMASTPYANLGSSLGETYQLDAAERWLREGIAYCSARDLDAGTFYMTAWLAVVTMHLGRWSEAADLAASVLNHPGASTISRIMACLALGRVRARRGDPDVWTALDEGLLLAEPTETLQRIAPVRAARAEAAWLGGDGVRAADEAGSAFKMAIEHRHPWHSGELAYWQRLAGRDVPVEAWVAEPWRLHLTGKHRASAEAWRALGCPYEAARSLADSTNVEDVREALSCFERLGARPQARHAIRRLKHMGVSSIPRGPRPATRGNPAGLTAREIDVLHLLSQGLRNAEIAERLSLSSRTVDHHVSALLRKLDATTRTEASARGLDLGLIPR